MQNLINKELVERRFSQNAKWYDEVTPVQSGMAENLIKYLFKAIPTRSIKSILELGCGTGKLTQLLFQRFPNCKLTGVDISFEMIRRLKQKITEDLDATLITADAETVLDRDFFKSKQFDLIISNTTVQWFNRPLITLKKYQSLLSRDGMLAFSTFGPDTFFELREAFLSAERRLGLPHRDRMLSFIPAKQWEKNLADQNEQKFFAIKEDYREETFLSVRDFLYTIKKTGATNPFRNNASFLTPSLYKRMVEEYQKHHTVTQSNKIKATFHLVYVLYSKNLD